MLEKCIDAKMGNMPCPRGCGEQLRYRTMEEHCKVCPERTVRCPLYQCNHDVKLNSADAMIQHIESHHDLATLMHNGDTLPWDQFIRTVGEYSLSMDMLGDASRFPALHKDDVPLASIPYADLTDAQMKEVQVLHRRHGGFQKPTDRMLELSRNWTVSEIYGINHGFCCTVSERDAVDGRLRLVYIQFFIASTCGSGRRLYYQATCLSGQEDGLYFHFNFVIPGSNRYGGPEICSAPIDAKPSLRILDKANFWGGTQRHKVGSVSLDDPFFKLLSANDMSYVQFHV